MGFVKERLVTQYFQNSFEVFSEVDLKGGVAITYWDKNQKFDKIGVFSSHEYINKILKKVLNFKSFEAIDNLIYTQNKFDLQRLYEDHEDYEKIIGSNGREKRLTTSIFSQLPIFTEKSTSITDVEVLGLIRNIRITRYLPIKYLEDHPNLKFHKVILPKSNGTGKFGELLSTPLVAKPKKAYTQSFISIGAFKNKREADACLKYIKSKFLRTMLGVLKVTQDNNKDVWKYVPLQNFTKNSDVDWSKSVQEIDLQLYRKYNLTEEEIEFIEESIKPM
ncbi:hypothetical protein AP75_13120 [Kaistella haifensis DSM 19056]|uniref:Uncharacterized protein n=1 Tax=Kaistella haifensis DSM 19056 TaxID=1450526 RepID=A0A246B6Q8_9FLAO|nr:restriction endonuclease [Kaistella haifensis]OWK97087.1 hypothetical protein AP75_13120 [Kaistella haifensis DSM 19056]